MSFHTEESDLGFCHYWKPDVAHCVNSSIIIGLDLDHTFIRPKKGRTFPKDFNDWEFIFEDITPLLEKQKLGCKIVFITNQKGIDVEKFQSKWRSILEDVKLKYPILVSDEFRNFHLRWYMLFSTAEDFYRKPANGMWNLISSKLNSNNDLELNKCCYVGDAAGRKDDFKATDLMFSLNAGVQFEVPEVFFGISGCNDTRNNTKHLVKQLKVNKKIFNSVEWLKVYYNSRFMDNKTKMQRSKSEILDDKFDVLVMVGCQGSGKSTFYTENLKEMGYILMSNDTFGGTPGAFKKQIEKYMSAGDKLVIDNTHPGKDIRKKWLELAHQYNRRCACLYMEATDDREYITHIFKLRNMMSTVCLQQKKVGCHKVIPIIALRTFYKKLIIPEDDEGFDAVIKIPLIVKFNEGDITKERFETWVD